MGTSDGAGSALRSCDARSLADDGPEWCRPARWTSMISPQRNQSGRSLPASHTDGIPLQQTPRAAREPIRTPTRPPAWSFQPARGPAMPAIAAKPLPAAAAIAKCRISSSRSHQDGLQGRGRRRHRGGRARDAENPGRAQLPGRRRWPPSPPAVRPARRSRSARRPVLKVQNLDTFDFTRLGHRPVQPGRRRSPRCMRRAPPRPAASSSTTPASSAWTPTSRWWCRR